MESGTLVLLALKLTAILGMVAITLEQKLAMTSALRMVKSLPTELLEETSPAVGKLSELFALQISPILIQCSCGEAGHMARQCPTAPEGSGNDGKCFNCGQEG